MNRDDLKGLLEHSRRKTLELVEAIGQLPDAAAVLAWRPGPGRAHIGWQLMHLGATDDRHLHIRMKGGQPRQPEYVRRFAGGSVPDDDVLPLAEIQRYLADRRRDLLEHLQGLSEADLAIRPNPQVAWDYREWFQVLAFHEAHHHGQAHLTFNLYRTLVDPSIGKVGH